MNAAAAVVTTTAIRSMDRTTSQTFFPQTKPQVPHFHGGVDTALRGGNCCMPTSQV
jgi:hypothetical protein